MSLTEDIRQVAEVPTAPPVNIICARTEATARVLLVWTRRTWTWAWDRSSAAGRPPHTGPGSMRWAGGCCARTAELSADHPGVSLEPEADRLHQHRSG